MNTFFTLWICCILIIVSCRVDANAQECVETEDNSCAPSQSEHCIDDDTHTCLERSHECDSDPSYMLIHCRKTCLVCLPDDETSSQDAGFGKIPSEISTQILQVMRQTNLYYSALNISEYALVSCRDKSEMCAFWAFHGQCTNPEYRDYMAKECPVTCRHCELLQARAFLEFLLRDLQQAYDSHGSDVLASRKASLSLLMSKLGMDPSAIGKAFDDSNADNWILELHSRLHSSIPPALLRLHDSLQGPVDNRELALLIALHGFLPDTPRDDLLSKNLVQYRSRGYILSIMRDVDHLITRPIQLLAGFAIPNNVGIDRLKQVSPLVQMGAGSGYWAGVLRRHGVDIVAYDMHPPSFQDNKNLFFDAAYIDDIQEGSCVDAMTKELAQSRTLLLIWPNDPDPVDNRDFCQDDGCQGSQAVWDADCLEAYVRAGGGRVVFVGERAAAISGGSSADCGLSATRRFQEMLQEEFVLVDTIKLPNWWLNEDDMTIWDRK